MLRAMDPTVAHSNLLICSQLATQASVDTRAAINLVLWSFLGYRQYSLSLHGNLCISLLSSRLVEVIKQHLHSSHPCSVFSKLVLLGVGMAATSNGT